jgi:RNA polymerase sigma factor (sigma-70 family)
MTRSGMDHPPPRSRSERQRWRAFERLYAAHFGLVWSVVRRMGVHDEAREDVVQDAWITIYRNVDRLRESASTRAFVVSFARNVALHHHRARGRRDRKHHALAELVDAGPDTTSAAEARDALAALLDRMGEDQGLVFVLVHVHGLTGREIADALGENVNTIHSRLRLARRHVQGFAAEQQLEEAALSSHVAALDRPEGDVRRRIAVAIAAQLRAVGSVAGSVGVFAATVLVGAAGLAVVAVVLPSAEAQGDRDVAAPIAHDLPARDEPTRSHVGVEPAVVESLPPTRPPVPRDSTTPASPRPSRAATPAPDVDTDLEREAALLAEVKVTLDAGDPRRALELLDRHAHAFPDGHLEDVRRGLRVRALCAAGRVQQARGEAAVLAAERPGSAVAAGTADACDE